MPVSDIVSDVFKVFGMSECAGPHTLSLSSNFRLESIGKTLPGLETRIDNPDEHGEGEVSTKPLPGDNENNYVQIFNFMFFDDLFFN